MMNIKRIFFFLTFLVSLGLESWGQDINSLLSSPIYASGGYGFATPEAPFSNRFNPALSALSQQFGLQASYFALCGVANSQLGHVANLGTTLPTHWAVITANASFLTAGFTGFQPGTYGRMTLGLSKDIWNDIFIGAGVDLIAGSSQEKYSWGLGLNLGLFHTVGDLGFLRDFRWGACLLNVGSWYTNAEGIAIPPAFTPAVGIDFALLKSNEFTWRLKPDMSFPSFQNVSARLSTTLEVHQLVSLDLSTRFDLQELLTGKAPQVPLSVGIQMSFALGGKSERDFSQIKACSALASLPAGVWAIGAGIDATLGMQDTQPPTIQVEDKTYYISPNNDGVQDELVLPMTITDSRYVFGYRLDIIDHLGQTIAGVQNKVAQPEGLSFESVWKHLISQKEGISVPPTLTWNALRQDGLVAADGTYTLTLTAWDDNSNSQGVEAGKVVVKTTPPRASLQASEMEFNPLGPRNQWNLAQTSSVEDLWIGKIKDWQGHEMRTFTWRQGSASDFSWDGRDDAGKIVNDGIYSYELVSVDRAGNQSLTKIPHILVNSVPTPIDLHVSRKAFSALGGGVKTISFLPKLSINTGISFWKVSVVDEKGILWRSFEGQESVPSEILFDGFDDKNNPLQEGSYKAFLQLQYKNGNNPRAESAHFMLKNTPPWVKVEASYRVFSPGSPNARNVMTFQQQTSEEELWTGEIKDQSGRLVRGLTWPGKAEVTYLWDGRGEDGLLSPDGTYFYTLRATDLAGNTTSSPALDIVIDTKERSVLLSTDRSAFTPSSSSLGKIKILPQVKGIEGLTQWSLRIEDEQGKIGRSFSTQTENFSTFFEWDGKNDQGQPMAEGLYYAKLQATFANGLSASAQSNVFRLKTQLPWAEIRVEQAVFNPLAKSRPQAKLFQTTSTEAEWKGRIIKEDKVIQEWLWKGEAPLLLWDGSDAQGNRVPDGTYSYELSTTDEAGNTLTKTLTGLNIDTRPTSVFLAVSAEAFSPNGDGKFDSLTLTTKLSLAEGVESWKLTLVHETLGALKTFQGNGLSLQRLVWDGQNDLQEKAPDGRYTAQFDVYYTKGDIAQAQSTVFSLQANPPEVELTLGGQPFSPDNDGVNDELLIGIGISSFVPLQDWKLEIADPEGNAFKSFFGKGKPASTLSWNGRSDSGELVQSASDYTMVFSARDTVANTMNLKKTISIDVLVIRDGDQLRIIIPSITFVQDKSDFLNVEQEKAAKNISVLQRLAEIFAKYSKYKILIEGHAVMVYWDNPVLGKKEQEQELLPLSQARAKAVKDFLVELGINASRINTMGVGGQRPIVPFSDKENRWKNRRVEFILLKD